MRESLQLVDDARIEEVMRKKVRSRTFNCASSSALKKGKKNEALNIGDANDVQAVYMDGWRCVTGRQFEKQSGQTERATLAPYIGRRFGKTISRMDAVRIFANEIFVTQLHNIVNTSLSQSRIADVSSV